MSTKLDEPVQLVFSATDPEVVPDGAVDAVWKPSFVLDGETRFLGPPVPREEIPSAEA